jgi:hypothetical protein
MQAGILYPCSSVNGVDFIAGLAQNAGVMADLTLPSSIGAQRKGDSRIRSIAIVSSENLSWEIQFFASHDGPNPNPNSDTFLGFVLFATAAAAVSPSGFYYYVDGKDIPYIDGDLDQHLGAAINVPQLHVRLVNRSAGAKGAYGAGGSNFKLTVNLEPTLGGI